MDEITTAIEEEQNGMDEMLEDEMFEDEPEEKKKKFGYDKRDKKFFIGKFRIGRTLLIIILIILIAAITFGACSANAKKKMEAAMAPKDVAVERRTVAKKVTGSSVIEPKNSYSIMTITTGEVMADYINEGDLVEKGDKLYQFDAETAQNSVQSAKNAVEKAQQSYNDALNTVSDLSVKSDASGIVSEVFVKEGENVQSGGKIASVYNDSIMKVKIPFNEVDAQSIPVGSSAALTVVGTGNELWGKVTDISTASVSTVDHNKVRYVTIETSNPGALTINDQATAMIGDIACNDAGTFEYGSEKTISAEASGKIISLNIFANDSVYKGQTIATLESSSASTSLKNAKLSLDDAKLSLEKAQKNLDDYTITAPISGTVVTKNSKAGDKIDSSNSTTPMCIIYDMSSMQFDISVDEIDIASVKVGQSVTVTADAVEGKTFTGVVEKVSIDGQNENGVTVYPITVNIADYGELLPGMNINAEIIVEQAENVLTIPVSSLNRGNTVYVKDENAAEEKQNKDDKNAEQVPEGYRVVEVKTGLSDDNYIEIKSGLNEGDIVRGQELDTSSDLQRMMQQRMGGMSGGAAGGPPAGGGGMSGGGGARSGGGAMPGGR